MRRLAVSIVAVTALAFGGVLLPAAPAGATHQPCDCNTSICSAQGFEITLTDFTIDQLLGTSNWTYEVCNQKVGGNPDCVPPKDLSHVDIVLPGLGECVTDTQLILAVQVDGFTNALLTCSASDRDPACPAELCAPGSGGKFCDANSGLNAGDACTNDMQCSGGQCVSVPCQPVTSPQPLRVLKCDVAPSPPPPLPANNLDPGECVKIQVTIAGEMPTIGPGAIDVVTKAGPECASNEICGPACNCGQPAEQCLTRTRGFWGTHPAITQQFLPVTVCGSLLDNTNAGNCMSATEAECSNSNEAGKDNQAYVQLVAQLTAAKLNLNATMALGGSCGPDINARITQCETLCDADQATISASGCIEDLDAFNNSQDTFSTTPPPFDNPGPANSTQCQAANGNGVVIGKGMCLL